MSNPIGEAVGYYTQKYEKQKHQQQQQQENDDTQEQHHVWHHFRPRSSRQNSIDELVSPTVPTPPQHQQRNDHQDDTHVAFSARSQWKKAMGKLHAAREDSLPRLPLLRRQTSNGSLGFRDLELAMVENRYGQVPPTSREEDEELTLPTLGELENLPDQRLDDDPSASGFSLPPTGATSSPAENKSSWRFSDESSTSQQLQPESLDPSQHATSPASNFFAHPFSSPPMESKDAPRPPEPVHDPATSSHRLDMRARMHWGKTMDKIRLISNLKKPTPRHTSTVTDAASMLAPFCQALYEPLSIATIKDAHGRKPPPVLLQFLQVDITDSVLETQGINQWVFRIELQYGDVKWVIRRKITDFVALHYTMKFKASVQDSAPAPPPFPNQLQSWINSAMETLRGEDIGSQESDGGKERKEIALQRRQQLTTYLRELLKRCHLTVSYDVCEFLEISAISIVQDMGWKGKECYLENRFNFVTPRICHFKPHLWQKEWVILRDSYLAFCSDIGSTAPTDVVLLDKNLRIGKKKNGLFRRYHHHIVLENQFRRIEIKGSKRQVEEWRDSIQKVQDESPWVKNHRFGSFAPIRHHSKVKWFVDAENYYNSVAEAILSARTEIYICDWWLSPELYLRRPPEKNRDFRLDRLLQRKAKEGVMIYIVIYKEMSLALTINSAHTKLWLQNLHPNIIVQRHPDHRSIDNNVLFWSHHEKIVVVDNKLAFIGGLDLCWGRYDSSNHDVIDAPAEGVDYEIFPGQDYSNPRVKDFQNVADYTQTLVDRKVTPRMPWHDAGIGVVGPIARDIARHFVQRWNFLKASKGMHRTYMPFLMPKGEFVAARDESHFKGTCRTQLLRSSAEWSSGIQREHSIYNAYMECISKAKHYIYIENQFFVSATTTDKVLRNKIAQAIVERIKKAHRKKENFKIYVVMPLIPAFEGDLASSEASAARTVMHFQYVSISRGGNSVLEKLREAGINPDDYIGFYSLRNWAKNKPRSRREKLPKDSALAGLDEVINSDTGSNSSATTDPLQRTQSSDEDDRQYYVSELIYIHDKLMIVDDRFVLIGSANINDRSQLGNRDSEIAMLIEDTKLVPSIMNGKPYNASKLALTMRLHLMKEHLGLLNFDEWDKVIPKPNEPDTPPSLPASPDLPSPEPARGRGRARTVTADDMMNFERTLPQQVLDDDGSPKLSGHSSIAQDVPLDYQALDPASDHFQQTIWNQSARTNTLVYRDLFRCVPDDTVHTFEQHRQFLPRVPHGHVADTALSEQDILQRLKKVRGHLVQFPTDYLKDENMLGSLIRETVTPMVIFT
ncbi:phospholipase D/nuclease [Hesseltinella vesiculosa]|uniref:Phospholipase n=1 Tax=Hesseltinella vesiculosa TaxID=101127 RepID=A0A1X2GAV0_9FUNG|nr:phospholipase D/nuclease [Hesseltinella vesiculosa]